MSKWMVVEEKGIAVEIEAEACVMEAGNVSFWRAGLTRAYAPGQWKTVERLSPAEEA